MTGQEQIAALHAVRQEALKCVREYLQATKQDDNELKRLTQDPRIASRDEHIRALDKRLSRLHLRVSGKNSTRKEAKRR
jgi:hypothetical protein